MERSCRQTSAAAGGPDLRRRGGAGGAGHPARIDRLRGLRARRRPRRAADLRPGLARLLRRNAEDGEVLRALGAGPRHDHGRRARRRSSSQLVGGAILADRGRRRVVPPGAHRRRTTRLSGSRRRLRLDGARRRVRGLGRRARPTAVLLAYRVSPHRAAPPRRGGGAESPWRDAAAALRPAPGRVTGIRSALGTGAGGRGAGALRRARRRARRRRGGRLDHLRRQPQLACLAARALRVELELRAVVGLFGRRGPACRPDGRLARPRPGCGALGGVYFETRRDRRSVRARPRRAPERRGAPTPLSGHGLQSDSQVVLGPATLARSTNKWATPSWPIPEGATVRCASWERRRSPPSAGRATRICRWARALSSPPRCSPPQTQRARQSSGGAKRSLHHHPAGGEPVGGAALAQPHQPGPEWVRRTARSAAWYLSYVRPRSPTIAPSGRPRLLAGVLAAGALGALGLTLFVLGPPAPSGAGALKTLGFTGRQLGASVAWQSSVAVAVGVIVGLPVGIALGRWLWTLFARGFRSCRIPLCRCCRYSSLPSARLSSPTSWPPFPVESPPVRRPRSVLRAE